MPTACRRMRSPFRASATRASWCRPVQACESRKIAASRSSFVDVTRSGFSSSDREHYETGLWAVPAVSVQPIFPRHLKRRSLVRRLPLFAPAVRCPTEQCGHRPGTGIGCGCHCRGVRGRLRGLIGIVESLPSPRRFPSRTISLTSMNATIPGTGRTSSVGTAASYTALHCARGSTSMRPLSSQWWRAAPARRDLSTDTFAVWLASADVVEIQGDTVCVVAVQSGVVIGPVG